MNCIGQSFIGLLNSGFLVPNTRLSENLNVDLSGICRSNFIDGLAELAEVDRDGSLSRGTALTVEIPEIHALWQSFAPLTGHVLIDVALNGFSYPIRAVYRRCKAKRFFHGLQL
jgi:hypothetical protein